MEIREAKNIQNYRNGVIEGEKVSRYSKKYADIKQIYMGQDDNILPETEMYEVYSLFDEEGKTLLWGLTIIHPITVLSECNMTRGHYHVDRQEPEIYFGLSGEGLLMFMRDNELFFEKVHEGTIHYIDGSYAHRLINTGDTDFKVGACWSKKAGHDYDSIEEKPFNVRVFKNKNGIYFESVD